MNPAATWFYTLIGNGQVITGEVAAVDPRDAVSRALTTSNTDGKMHGQQLGVNMDLLHAVPANFDKFYEVKSDATYISVREQSYVPAAPRTMLELRALWEILRDVPGVDRCDEYPDGSSDAPYLHFPRGTPFENIWYWFEAQNPAFVTGEVLMGVWPK